MGALTNKIIQFSYRPWENLARLTIDNSEITRNSLRVETNKIKKIRFLPINYWVTNHKRFQIQKEPELLLTRENNTKKRYLKTTEINPFLFSSENKNIYIKLTPNMQNQIYFSAKKLSINCRNVYNDLLLVKDNKYSVNLSTKMKIKQDISQNTIILANTRIEVPEMTGHIQFNYELYDHACFSGFSSSLNRTQLPFSNYSLLFSFFYGFMNKDNTTILVSFFTKVILTFTPNWFYLKPLYIDNTQSYPKYIKNRTFYLLSNKMFNIYNYSLLNTHSIIDYQLTFDSFLYKKVRQNFVHRLLIFIIIAVDI